MKICLKLMCALLLVSMVWGLVACSNNKPGTEQPTSENKNPPTIVANNDEADLPDDLDFGGEVFTIKSIVQQPASREFEAALNGSVIDQAVYSRNREIEEKYNCTILNNETVGNTNTPQMLQDVTAMIDGGLYSNHILVTAGYRMCSLAVNGLLTNIRSMEGINLSKDYYSQGHNEALSYGDAQFLITGKMSMSYYRYMLVMFYNRTLFANFGIEDPYEMVIGQEWTYEKATEIAEQIREDRGGVDESTYGFVGFVGSNSSQTDGFMSSANLHVIGKNDDGSYKLDINTQQFSSAIDKILRLLYSEGSYVSTSWSEDGNVAVLKKFANGTAGMMAFRMYGVEDSKMVDLGKTGLGYGILPLPKADRNQEDYVSYVQDQCFLFGFPTSLPEELKQTVGWFFEAYSSNSYKVTKSTYYEKALTARYLDEKSTAIMEIIDSKVYVDPVNVYLSSHFSFNTERLRLIYGDPASNNIGSMLGKYVTEGKLQQNIDDLNEIFDSLRG